jgi:ubiquinone/menaquinone biosynthesis C-methylase UbiE
VEERYALSNTDEERERLARQGDLMRSATERLFRAAGIAPGARVLDCGSGAGDVSLIAAELVTSSGDVVGIDRDSDQVSAANRRVADIGLSHVRFETAELSAPPPGRFDAIIGRMVLKYLPDPEAVLRILADRLVPGGVMAFLEWDFMRSAEWGMWPRTPLMDQLMRWNVAAFQALGVQERMGSRLPSMFRSIGLKPQPPYEVTGLVYEGIAAVDQVVAIVRASMSALTEYGIATEEEIGIDTLAERLSLACGPDPLLLMSPHLGVWATKP